MIISCACFRVKGRLNAATNELTACDGIVTAVLIILGLIGRIVV